MNNERIKQIHDELLQSIPHGRSKEDMVIIKAAIDLLCGAALNLNIIAEYYEAKRKTLPNQPNPEFGEATCEIK